MAAQDTAFGSRGQGPITAARRNSSASSRADRGRRSGSLSRQRSTTRSTLGGIRTSGFFSAKRGAVPRSKWNGRRPVRTSKRMIPTE
jgi:hypothetical protein